MSLKKIRQVKRSGYFCVFDLIIYGVLVAAIAVGVVLLTALRDRSPLQGVTVTYRGTQIFSYDFGGGKYEIYSPDNVQIVSEDEKGLTVKLLVEGGYNDLYIDKKAVSAKIVASDCSMHRDCVYTAAVVENGSTPIICQPHGLTVRAVRFIDDGTVVL